MDLTIVIELLLRATYLEQDGLLSDALVEEFEGFDLSGVSAINQVWPLTHFFLFLFQKHYSLPFLPATPLSPSRTHEGNNS